MSAHSFPTHAACLNVLIACTCHLFALENQKLNGACRLSTRSELDMANRPVYHQYTAQSRLKPDRIYLELVFRVHGPNPIKFGSAIALSSGHPAGARSALRPCQCSGCSVSAGSFCGKRHACTVEPPPMEHAMTGRCEQRLAAAGKCRGGLLSVQSP